MSVEDFFEKFVKNKIEYYHQIENENRKKNIIFSVLFLMIIPSIIVLYVIKPYIDEWIISVLFIIIFFMLFLFLIFSKEKEDHILLYFKKNILALFFKYCFSNVDYKYDKPFSKKELKQISKYLIFNDKMHSNDSIDIQICNKRVQLTNIYYYHPIPPPPLGRGRSEKRYGIIIKIPINNYDNKKISVIYNGVGPEISDKLRNFLMKVIKLPFEVYKSQKYIKFNKIFTLLMSDCEKNDKIEDFIKNILDIYEKYKLDHTRIGIINNYCYVVIYGRTLKNLVDSSLNKETVDIRLTNDLIIGENKYNFYTIYNNMNSIQKIIKDFLELEQYIK